VCVCVCVCVCLSAGECVCVHVWVRVDALLGGRVGVGKWMLVHVGKCLGV